MGELMGCILSEAPAEGVLKVRMRIEGVLKVRMPIIEKSSGNRYEINVDSGLT